ncbi:hypothetical protein Scep_001172 [Stephania cephalantha]|uniref:Uncharacterized protein n=1 Tax=Stephania cephalantha TaxID=152367 RepID=A0AAP0L7N0_9MAGN
MNLLHPLPRVIVWLVEGNCCGTWRGSNWRVKMRAYSLICGDGSDACREVNHKAAGEKR